jgi:hypothetical protein
MGINVQVSKLVVGRLDLKNGDTWLDFRPLHESYFWNTTPSTVHLLLVKKLILASIIRASVSKWIFLYLVQHKCVKIKLDCNVIGWYFAFSVRTAKVETFFKYN